ncbi:MAG: carboxypeptidase regulatory-like domain-containing protein [Armatimonadota bacterium]
MNSRGIASAARRLGVTLLIVTLFTSLVTIGWGKLTAPGRAGLAVLGPSVRSSALLMTSARGATPGLVNLTHSPAVQRNPSWSPNGQLIAFTSNGTDTNNDERIDTVNSERSLFTMNADGSGLEMYPLASGSVQWLAWRPDGQAIYVVVVDSGSYFIRLVTLATRVVTDIYTAPPSSEIGSVSVAPSGTLLYFDMTVSGQTQIYQLSATVPAAIPVLLPNQIGNNRHPILANGGVDLVFETDRDNTADGFKHWHIYRMNSDGSLPRALTQPLGASDDRFPRVTADGKYLVFSSNRMTTPTDPTYNENIWMMPYGQEWSTPEIVVTPRFFMDTSLSENQNQTEPAPQTDAGRVNEILFISTKDGNADIYKGTLVDDQAPYVNGQVTATPKIAQPGTTIRVTAPVVDADTGVRNVWLQVKNPNPNTLDSRGINHVLSKPVFDWNQGALALYVQNTQTSAPVEFGPLNPVDETYPDLINPTSHPGYYARAGAVSIFTDEGAGYPAVSPYWIKMYDDGTNGDAVADDGIYTCMWTTPSVGSDWYFDIIVEDMVNAALDTNTQQWHGNRRRFDNIGGCSTQAFIGGKKILLVDDHLDGQRFLTLGLPPIIANYTAPGFLNSLYYFIDGVVPGLVADPLATPDMQPELVSPFLPNSEFGGADVWRVLARGKVTDAVLNAYLPTQVTNVSPTDGRTPVPGTLADKVVVWASPNAWYRQVVPGSILETATQLQLQQFVTAGGRLFVIGSDLATGLTDGGTKQNDFLKTTLGATLQAQSVAVFGTNITSTPSKTSDWYGFDLVTSRSDFTGIVPRNDNPSQYVLFNPLTNSGTELTWDLITPTFEANSAYSLSSSFNSQIVGVSKETTQSRTVFWSFGYEHVSSHYRSRMALDTIEWLLDGGVAGKVAQINDLSPIPDALVIVSEYRPSFLFPAPPLDQQRGEDIGAARTDSQGNYLIQGIRPGREYVLVVKANGYYGTTAKLIGIRGGKVTVTDATAGTDTSFFLYRDINTSTLWGYVTRGTTPVVGATVKASALGGGDVSTTTDSNGKYNFVNLAPGDYVVTATQSSDSASSTVTLTAGDNKRNDLQLGTVAPTPNTLTGFVMGNGVMIPSAKVHVRQGTQTIADTTTNLNGMFTVSPLTTGTYQIDVKAPGFYDATQSISFAATTGLTITIQLTSISSNPTAAHVSGSVYDGAGTVPLSSATIEVLVGSDVVDSRINSSTFEFVLNAGTYVFRVSAAGRQSVLKTINLSPSDLVTGYDFHLLPLLTVPSGAVMFSLPGNYGIQQFSSLFNVAAQSISLASFDPRLATPTAADGYRFFTGADFIPVQPGRGYWIKMTQAASITQEGTPIDTGQPFQVALYKGWNIIGNPFPFTVDLYDSTVQVGASFPVSWSQAVQANIVGNAVYTWNGWRYSQGTLLNPYFGYWVYTTDDCTLNISNRQSLRTAAPAVSRRASTTSEWRVRLEVRAGESRDTENYFGVSAAAKGGFNNQLDSRKPPTAMGNYVSLAFPHMDWGANSGDFASEIQSPSAGSMQWKFRVDTNRANTQVVITVPELMAQLPKGYEAILTDEETQQSCYLNTSSQYSFFAGTTGASRDFVVTVQPRTSILQVTSIRGNFRSGRGERGITYVLSQPAQVTVLIRNQAGRLVRTLIAGQLAVAGTNSLAWDGKDEAGRFTPRGVYFCEVQASDSIGRRARGTGLLNVLSQQ